MGTIRKFIGTGEAFQWDGAEERGRLLQVHGPEEEGEERRRDGDAEEAESPPPPAPCRLSRPGVGQHRVSGAGFHPGSSDLGRGRRGVEPGCGLPAAESAESGY